MFLGGWGGGGWGVSRETYIWRFLWTKSIFDASLTRTVDTEELDMHVSFNIIDVIFLLPSRTRGRSPTVYYMTGGNRLQAPFWNPYRSRPESCYWGGSDKWEWELLQHFPARACPARFRSTARSVRPSCSGCRCSRTLSLRGRVPHKCGFRSSRIQFCLLRCFVRVIK